MYMYVCALQHGVHNGGCARGHLSQGGMGMQCVGDDISYVIRAKMSLTIRFCSARRVSLSSSTRCSTGHIAPRWLVSCKVCSAPLSFFDFDQSRCKFEKLELTYFFRHFLLRLHDCNWLLLFPDARHRGLVLFADLCSSHLSQLEVRLKHHCSQPHALHFYNCISIISYNKICVYKQTKMGVKLAANQSYLH